jgi:hypothetical protein
MKKIILIGTLLLIACTNKEEAPNQGGTQDKQKGCIFGKITKYYSGNANDAQVHLLDSNKIRIGSPANLSDYKFYDLDAGKYYIMISKVGFDTIRPEPISVLATGNEQESCQHIDWQISKIPSTLCVIDVNTSIKLIPLDTLDFGASLLLRRFQIYNNTEDSITWSIRWEDVQKSCNWVSEITHEGISTNNTAIISGTLASEGMLKEPVHIYIDRSKWSKDKNPALIPINGGESGWDLFIKATGNSSPELVTQTPNPNDISYTSAILHGTITDLGNPPYTIRGFEYSTASDFTTNLKSVKEAVTPDMSFSIPVLNLNVNKRYYVRAFATNNIGQTSYGKEPIPIYFDTKTPVSPQVSANSEFVDNLVASATITNAGEPPYHEIGFCWNTYFYPSFTNKKIIEKDIVETFSTTLPDSLAPEEFYRVWAYAINDYDTAYSNSMICVTELPILYKTIVTEINKNNARVEDMIVTEGNPDYIERGFYCATTTSNLTIPDNKIRVEGYGKGIFEANIHELLSDTTYYVQAFAKNILGTRYGTIISFKTK